MKVVLKMVLVNVNELVNTTLQKILIFIGGIVIGILLILLVYLIISIIHKISKKNTNKSNKINIPTSDPSEIILKYKTIYLNNYANKAFTKRISFIKDSATLLIKDIASIYYPSSKDPMLEVSFDNLINLTNRVLDKIENMVSEIIDSSLFKFFWTSFAGASNIVGFIKGIFNKEKDEYLTLNIRKLKISYIIDKLDNIKSKPKKDKPNTNEEKKYFLLDEFINNKVLALIDEIAAESIVVYSNSYNQIVGGNK